MRRNVCLIHQHLCPTYQYSKTCNQTFDVSQRLATYIFSIMKSPYYVPDHRSLHTNFSKKTKTGTFEIPFLYPYNQTIILMLQIPLFKRLNIEMHEKTTQSITCAPSPTGLAQRACFQFCSFTNIYLPENFENGRCLPSMFGRIPALQQKNTCLNPMAEYV